MAIRSKPLVIRKFALSLLKQRVVTLKKILFVCRCVCTYLHTYIVSKYLALDYHGVTSHCGVRGSLDD
jgi:hypothetical protein